MKSEEIAGQIGCSDRTVRRELAKGKTELLNSDLSTRIEYSADIGQQKHDYAGTAKGPMLKIGKDYGLVEYIEMLIIKEKMSPYAAAQRIKQEGKFKTSISYKTIYNYIDAGLFPSLTNKHLPVQRKAKKRKHDEVRQATNNTKGTSISERPESVGNLEEYGHWEMDTVVSGKGSKVVLLVLTERKTREKIIRKIKSKSHEGVLCHPYSAWERGLNENANKLISRFIPKGADIGKFSHERIKMIEHWINNYPRRIFGGLSSNMVK